MMKILSKEVIKKVIIILIIFIIGFSIRIESFNLHGISVNEKAFYQDPNGLPYMYELDSYYNYRLTQNLVDHGYLGDAIINSTEWDLHSYSPGVPLDYPPLLPYLTAFFYKIINLFISTPLIVVSFWLPAIIGPLCGIPAYLLVKKMTNDYGGLAAGILAVTAPFYLIRTVPGWFDTDMFNILLPLLIILFFIEAVQHENKKMSMFFAILSAISMFLFAMAWNGWQYLFYIIVLFCIFYIITGKLKKKNMKNYFNVFIVFSAVSLLLIGIVNYSNILNLAFGPLEFILINSNQHPWAPWPDLYVSVSELGNPSLKEIWDGLNPITFILGILGFFAMASILIKKDAGINFRKIDSFFYLLLVVWTIAGFIALMKGARFIILLLPPLIISSGILVGISMEYLKKYLISKKRENLIKFSYIFIVIILIFSSFLSINASLKLTPMANDNLWDSAIWIQNNTHNNTVIFTEWSYGHFLSSIADRPVAFDGRSAYIETLPLRQFYNNSLYNPKSPSTSREYWIDRAFSTSDESLSLGIFRMISTSGDKGYLILDKYTGNTTKSIEILNNILGLDKESALKVLTVNYNLNEENAKEVIKYTHPDNPNPFVILTNEKMISGAKWTFYFGEWDFANGHKGNYTYSTGKFNLSRDTINSTNNITGNLNNLTWNGKTPYCITIITNNKTSEQYLNKNSDFCIILIMNSNKSIVIDKESKNSLFTKLVIERKNTKLFKSVYENEKISVWKAN